MPDIQHLASLTEEDVKNRYITPTIEQAGWRKDQYRMEYPFTDGRIISAGSEYERASRKKADYVLYLNNDNLLLVMASSSVFLPVMTELLLKASPKTQLAYLSSITAHTNILRV